MNYFFLGSIKTFKEATISFVGKPNFKSTKLDLQVGYKSARKILKWFLNLLCPLFTSKASI